MAQNFIESRCEQGFLLPPDGSQVSHSAGWRKRRQSRCPGIRAEHGPWSRPRGARTTTNAGLGRTVASVAPHAESSRLVKTAQWWRAGDTRPVTTAGYLRPAKRWLRRRRSG